MKNILDSVGFRSLSVSEQERYHPVLALLDAHSPPGHADYLRRLADRCHDAPTLHDLLWEGRAAAIFLAHGHAVQMGDRPDLHVQVAGTWVAAEVKRFRLKPQDGVDAERLRAWGGRLETYGDTAMLEGAVAWRQVLGVLHRKSASFPTAGPNLLVLGSDSTHCIEEVDAEAAVNEAADLARQDPRHATGRIGGVLFIGHWYSCATRRAIYHYPNPAALVSFEPRLRDALDEIRSGRLPPGAALRSTMP